MKVKLGGMQSVVCRLIVMNEIAKGPKSQKIGRMLCADERAVAGCTWGGDSAHASARTCIACSQLIGLLQLRAGE